MKKVLILAVLLVVSFSNAQKGSILVMGSIGLSSGKSTNNFDASSATGNSFIIAPKVGYQFSENWTTGIYGTYSTSKNESFNSTDNVTNTSKSNNYFIGPFLRYTKKLTDLFSVYGDLETGLGVTEYKIGTSETNNESTTKLNSFGASLTPAVFINLKNNFGLNFGIGGFVYNNTKSEQEQSGYENKNNGFNFTLGQSLNIGVSKNF